MATNSLDPIPLDSKASTDNPWARAWFGARDARQMPARVSHADVASTVGSLSEHDRSRSWWRHGLRFVRDAAIGLSILAVVPFAVIGTRGEGLLRNQHQISDRVAEVERLRPLMVARNATITPTEAGALLHRLNPTKAPPSLPMHAVSEAPARPWDTMTPSDEMFGGLRADGNEGRMAAGIVTAAARGFNAQELAYLLAVADAPIWREVERLASAPAVDVIGGRFVLPFRADATAWAMPVLRFNDTKRLAYAGVSRAAYYVATGQPLKAEAALKTVVSYGFVLVDNGSHTMDALIGRVIIGIGQNGLHQLYTLTGDARGMALTAPFANVVGRTIAPIGGDLDADAALARLLRDARDPTMPRTVRLEALHQLSVASCSSVRGMVFGPSDAVQDAFAQARGDLARYPSERAYLDLMYGTVDRTTDLPWRISRSDMLVMGAASATSAVLGNPRVASCTRIVLANQ